LRPLPHPATHAGGGCGPGGAHEPASTRCNELSANRLLTSFIFWPAPGPSSSRR